MISRAATQLTLAAGHELWLLNRGQRRPIPGTQALVARMDDPKAAQGWSLFLANANYGFYLISKWPNDAIKVTTTKALAKKDTWQHVVVTYDGSGKAEGIKLYVDGVMAPLNLEVNKLTTSSQAKTPTRLGQRSTRLACSPPRHDHRAAG